MNAATLRHWQDVQTVADTLAWLFPEVPADDRDRRTPLTADAPAWEAIDDALDLLHAIDPTPGPATIDEPAAWRHWLRRAWVAVVLASHAAAGQELEPADLERLSHAELADALTYQADYQG